MFDMLEPTTFPTAKSASPFFAATADVTSSGKDVPIATTVRPTNVSLIPTANARLLAQSTTTSPPTTIATIPPRINQTHLDLDIRISPSSPCVLSLKA